MMCVCVCVCVCCVRACVLPSESTTFQMRADTRYSRTLLGVTRSVRAFKKRCSDDRLTPSAPTQPATQPKIALTYTQRSAPIHANLAKAQQKTNTCRSSTNRYRAGDQHNRTSAYLVDAVGGQPLDGVVDHRHSHDRQQHLAARHEDRRMISPFGRSFIRSFVRSFVRVCVRSLF